MTVEMAKFILFFKMRTFYVPKHLFFANLYVFRKSFSFGQFNAKRVEKKVIVLKTV